MHRLALPLAILFFALSGGTAFAHSTVYDGCDNPPPPPVQPSLQEILDDLVVSGPPIEASSATNPQLFEATDTPMLAQLVFTFLNPDEYFAFGIYDADNPNNPAFLLAESFEPSDVVTVTFSSNGTIAINGGWVGTAYSGFDGPFGFFIKRRNPNGNPVYLYSQDELNGGEQRVKVFQGNDETMLQFPGLDPALFLSDQFLLAWETGLGSEDDGAFDDFIVSVSAISAVPEPGAWVLLGLAVGALARMRRARPY